jgi:hypothetical protein
MMMDILVDDNVHYKCHNTGGEVDNKAWTPAPAMEVAKQNEDSHPLLQLYRMVCAIIPEWILDSQLSRHKALC